MLHRLGQAISWISVIVAVFLFGFAGIVLFTQTPGDFEFFRFLVFSASCPLGLDALSATLCRDTRKRIERRSILTQAWPASASVKVSPVTATRRR